MSSRFRGRAPGGGGPSGVLYASLVLAVPGLSWNVAEDMIERGDMPNLATLRRRGAWGELRSVPQPLTPMVWTTIATGKTSDEHGVVAFSSTE